MSLRRGPLQAQTLTHPRRKSEAELEIKPREYAMIGPATTGGMMSANRDEKGRFGLGNTANPGGKTHMHHTFTWRCRSAVNETVIDAWIDEVVTRGPHWVRASELLAAYGYGRPSEKLKVEDATMETRLPREILDALLLWRRERDAAAKPAAESH